MIQGAKYFPGFLETLMRKNGVSQVELNKRTGIAVSRINNYLKGKYRTVTPEHLEQICIHVSESTLERSELLKIYLLDMLTEKLRPMVEINPLTQPRDVEQHWIFQLDRLPKEFNDTFRELYKMCSAHTRVRERTATWIRIMQETLLAKEVRQAYSSHIRKPRAAAGGVAEAPTPESGPEIGS